MKVKDLIKVLCDIEMLESKVHLLPVDDPCEVGDGIYSEPACGVSVDGSCVTILNAK